MNQEMLLSLADKKQPYAMITFVHPTDKQIHLFYSIVNRLTGDRMTSFDNDPPFTNDSMKWVKTTFRNIRERAKVLKCIGTRCFSKQ